VDSRNATFTQRNLARTEPPDAKRPATRTAAIRVAPPPGDLRRVELWRMAGTPGVASEKNGLVIAMSPLDPGVP
jgi:hypothetical protein